MSSTTDPGNKSAAEIERELDEERARLARTADALQEKLSVGSLIDEVMQRVQSEGGEFGRNLGRTVRDNPLPVALVAIGLGWMLAGGQDATNRRHGAFGRFRNGRDYDDGWEDAGYASMSGYRSRNLPVAYGEDLPSGISRGHHEGPGMAERAGEAASAAGHGVAGAASSAAGAARSAAAGVSDAASRAAGAASDAASYAGEQAWAAGRAVSHGGARLYGDARYYGRRASDGMEEFVEEQPLVAAALSFAVGAAIGSLLPNSRAENRLMGEYAERTRHEAADALSAEARKARRVAEAAADEAGRMVSEAVDEAGRKAPDGRTLVDEAEHRARDAADRIGGAAEREARRQDLGGSVRKAAED